MFDPSHGSLCSKADTVHHSRDVVPLSLQPVHLRRHTPSSPSEDEVDASQSDLRRGPVVNVSHEDDHASYHGQRQQSLAEPLHYHPSRGTSDSYQHQSRSPQSSAYLTRPSSSRTQSPTFVYNLPQPVRHPSHSPALSTRPISASPVGYYNPMSQSLPSYGSSQQLYYPSRVPLQEDTIAGPSSPSVPLSPSHEFYSLRSSQPLSTSRSQPSAFVTDPPPQSRTTSAASLTNLLNAAVPTSQTMTGMGGLEALVQAATQERRRLSGEMQSSEGREETARHPSASPIMSRASALPEIVHQPHEREPTATPVRPHLDLLLDTGSSDFRSAQASSTRIHSDGEPPAKRRRKSGSFSPDLRPAEPPSHVIVSPSRLCPHLWRMSNAHLPCTRYRTWRNRGRPRMSMAVVKLIHLRKCRPPTVEGVAVPVEEHRSGVGGLGDAVVAEEPAKKEKKKRDKPLAKKERGHAAGENEAVGHRSSKRQDKSQEDDPHEWLLEHYSTASPPRVSQIPSPAEVKKCPPSKALQSSHGTDSKRDDASGGSACHNSPQKHKAKSPPSEFSSRTPTPLAMLEQELDGITATPRTKTETHGRDSSLELDLVASAALDDGGMDNSSAMDLDVDDELLSLLDEKPRHSHSRPPHFTQHHEKHHRSKPSSPTKLHANIHSIRSPATAHAGSERESMPPPTLPTSAHTKDAGVTKKADRSENIAAAASMKKKDGGQKPVQKAKPPAKPKAKSTAKPKTKASKEVDSISTSNSHLTAPNPAKNKKTSPHPPSAVAMKRSVSAAAGPSRSRSTSVMPRASVGPEVDGKTPIEEAQEEENEAVVDDKLYCICKTQYDEDRVMIACDRCDEWYHTQCLHMPDLEVDLIDQFICPLCIENNPHLSLRTTYKRRCMAGLQHPHPSSPSACHKPARGALSKYCSDECGIVYMQLRISSWAGEKERLWGSVQDAHRREGVVVKSKFVQSEVDDVVKPEANGNSSLHSLSAELPGFEVVKPLKTKLEREQVRLNAELDKVARRRDELKKEMEVILWREKLIELAAVRAETIDECGWDQRLCFGDEEYAEFGAGVLDSYEESEQQDAMQVDGGAADEGEWWCRGKKKCDRHAGWQKLRSGEIDFDKDLKERAILALTTQEREIRKQIEDTMDPQAKTSVVPTSPLINGKTLANGMLEIKVNGDSIKKGKKRKT
ncbi:Set1 complex component spp1 [Grifola frondosa]|uniref:Set1 complex component spp1 n=1 Tax=Grifola frondosa TaxID=5627 RepID=A0A1C7MUE1_GRIFR|nr:Set1 complex component spp1 [Grifola frondosa]